VWTQIQEEYLWKDRATRRRLCYKANLTW